MRSLLHQVEGDGTGGLVERLCDMIVASLAFLVEMEGDDDMPALAGQKRIFRIHEIVLEVFLRLGFPRDGVGLGDLGVGVAAAKRQQQDREKTGFFHFVCIKK